MMNVLLVFEQTDSLKNLEKGLSLQSGCHIDRAHSWPEALGKITAKTLDLVIVDQELSNIPGKQLLDKIVAINPMVNTALVSELSDEDFHEDTEGLGVLMKISPNPDESEAATLVEKLKKVLSLYQTLKP